MSIYLGLGSNLGDRRAALEAALEQLSRRGVRVERLSPVVESPALLPHDAPADWNRPFLNLVAQCSTDASPQDLLASIKDIEYELGRADERHWSPRPIDIDILLWGTARMGSDTLRIPHPALHRRAFALTPLAALSPGAEIPGTGRTALQSLRELPHPIPLWMGIVNLTPDSFSDGGRFRDWPAVEILLRGMEDAGVHIVDLGAESTRPGAEPLTAVRELERLQPMLERVVDRYSGRRLRPLISVDTYHADVARRAIELGADIVNDVGGLTDPRMIELAAEPETQWVAMHQLSLPADPGRTLATDVGAVEQVEAWLETRLEAWSRAGVDANRIAFDPGIGFGKNPLQSLELIRGIEHFKRHGLRLLVGHSRKSFMRGIAGDDVAMRDLATIGASMALCEQGVDILRVHDVPGHTAAYRGWVHARA